MEAPPPGTEPFFDLRDDDQLQVAAWRESQLTRRGVGLLDARILAVRRDLDLHMMTDMLDAGCAVHTLKETLL